MRQQRNGAAPKAAFVIDAPTSAAIEGADTLHAQGIIVTTLEEAAMVHPELVQRAFSAVRVDESKFVALWNALWRGGVFVYVPRGVEALVPVWIAHPASGTDRAVFPSTVVVLDEGAALTVIDAYASTSGPAALFSDAMVILSAGRDARLDYDTVQQWGEGVWHVAVQRTVLDANAKLRFMGVTLGARLQKVWWDVLLEGIGSEADVLGICFGDGTQHFDHQSLQAHRGAETRSNLLLKVAVRDRARSVYGGMIDVAPTAVHADGYVANRNLLLSQGAKADSIPKTRDPCQRREVRSRCHRGPHRLRPALLSHGPGRSARRGELVDRPRLHGRRPRPCPASRLRGARRSAPRRRDRRWVRGRGRGGRAMSEGWVDVARVSDIPPGCAARVEIDETPVAIFNVDGTFYALDDTCSHAEASLSEGDLDIDRCVIECPLHGSSFDLRTGEPLSLPAVEPVRAHRIETTDDGVLRVALATEVVAS